MDKTTDPKEAARAHVRELAAEFQERGDQLGWFEALYAEARGSTDHIPWADLEPNPFFRQWADSTALRGYGREALVVGCGLGDEARYLDDLGFKVTAFDISPTAIEWASKLSKGKNIRFEVANMFEPPPDWVGGFEFVLEIYTIQPLPMDLREPAIDAVASFVAPSGELIVVTRGRDDDEEVSEIPYPLSPGELRRFERNGLSQIDFVEMLGDEEEPARRFVVAYKKERSENVRG